MVFLTYPLGIDMSDCFAQLSEGRPRVAPGPDSREVGMRATSRSQRERGACGPGPAGRDAPWPAGTGIGAGPDAAGGGQRLGTPSAPSAPDGRAGAAEAAGPSYDVRALLRQGRSAQLVLDGRAYALRITRAGKLILTR